MNRWICPATMLAATVAVTVGKTYTQNLKHYPMPDVAVLKGWSVR